MRRRSYNVMGLFISAVAVTTADSVRAQDVAMQIDEVVVTAQKREERLIDVPQSVSVMSPEDLQKLSATQFRDFANTVPGLNFTTSGPGSTQISMRGVTAGTDVNQTVAVYVDDIPYGSSTSFGRSGRYTPDGSLFDLERIEVLRGPQGTLYGASSMGGLLKYVSRAPGLDGFSGRILGSSSSTAHGSENYNVAGVLNVPLATDNAAVRVSGYYTRDGGYVDNPALGDADVNHAELHGVRADFMLTPSDELTVRLIAESQSISRDGTPEVDFTATAGGRPVLGSLRQSRQVTEPFDQDFRLVAGTVDYDFGSALLTSITSYQETRTENRFDISAEFVPLLAQVGLGTFNGVGLSDEPSTDKVTQEIRLTSQGLATVEWAFGAFYTREESDRESEMLVLDSARQPVPNIFYTLSAPSEYEEYALFGNITWRLTDNFDITGGLRYAHNRQSYTQFGSGIFIDSQPTVRSSEGVSTYLANARYHLNEYAMVYGRFATGYRPGGPNFVARDPATGSPLAPPTFDSDRLKSYEVGYKAETADGRFGVDIAAYYVDWVDIQVFDASSALGGLMNGDSASVRGGEATLTARPTSGLTLSANGSYSTARRSGIDTDGQYSAALIVDYAFLSVPAYTPFMGATVRHVSERGNAITTTTPQELPDYTTVDLRAGADIGDLRIQLFGRNIFDTRGRLSLVTSGGKPVFSILQPRTIGISLSADF
ncbi:TonB-dependent receptor [Kineobactrum salinum]|uniref:TonB-dependent receptor n=1 Tax=Kineobactrum salinum TaxID=2708301 RepID=A0A6C0U340_9GAMM|nr:TonB-dependent receptor [Kineobactrum salinum]QIB66511.1 TonB-dependent receptor [Kineobactrum salinum]